MVVQGGVTAGEWQVNTTKPVDKFRHVVVKVAQKIGHSELSYLGNVVAQPCSRLCFSAWQTQNQRTPATSLPHKPWMKLKQPPMRTNRKQSWLFWASVRIPP
jgi:hypothetical protein